MSNEVFFKPSLNLDSFFGDEFFEDNERFLLFLKAYYEWLQTTRITIVNETGTFQRGEQIVGATSRATGIIKEVKADSLVIQVTTKKAFAKSETITGQTSAATATVYAVKDNVVRATGNVVDYRNLDTSIDKYFEYLKEELYTSLPVSFYGNKSLVASKFKDFFNSKSNEQSYRFLFRLLYNEEIDFYYPGDDIIRSSDGNYEKTQVIRVTESGFGTDALGNTFSRNIFDFLNKTIRGKTSGSLAFVVDIKKFFIGSIETAEFTLRLVSDDFIAGEEIVDIDDEDLNATIYGIVAGFTIVDGGSGYQVGDSITITGDGSEAQAVVSSIKQSPITNLKVNEIGYGYRLGTTATITNTGTGGSGLIVRVTEIANTYTVTNANTGNTYTVGEISEVSIINRGSNYFASPTITIVDTTIESLGLLSDKLVTIVNPGTNYQVGDSLVITANTGANAVGQVASVTANASFSNSLIFEDGLGILFEQSFEDELKTEDWDVGSYGPIRRIEFTNFGDGYSSEYPPTITVNTSSGANASLLVTGIQGMSANVQVDAANNETGIGSIRAIEIKNFGIDYSTANANVSAIGDGNANVIPIISGIGVSEGKWLDDDGKIDYKILQDSFYYQDYSYVIKSGLTVEKYIDTIKKSIHPAGLQVFGELLLIDSISVTPEFKSSIDTIKDFIVRIYDFISVATGFEGFDIHLETKFESFAALQVALIPNTDLATQEYVIQVVAGGDDTTNIIDNTISSAREIIVNAPSDIDVTMTALTPPVRKLIVSYNQTFDAYSERTYGDLFLRDYAETDISDFAIRTFAERFGTIPYEFGEYVLQLVPGGGDTSFTEDLSISTQLIQKFIIESFWDSSATVLISDVQTAQTGTREVVVDRITLANVESTHAATEFINQYGFDPLNVEIYSDQKYSVFIESLSFANVEIQTIITFSSVISDTVLTLYSQDVAQVQIVSEFQTEYIFGPLILEIDTAREYAVIIESLGLANSEFSMIIAASAVAPQKQQFAEGIIYLYGTPFGDAVIQELGEFRFTDDVIEDLTNLGYTYGSRSFDDLFRLTPRTEHEYVVQYQTVSSDEVQIGSTLEYVIEHLDNAESSVSGIYVFPIELFTAFSANVISSDVVPYVSSSETSLIVPIIFNTSVESAAYDQEYVIQLYAEGFRIGRWDDEIIGDYTSDQVSTIASQSFGDAVEGKLIYDRVTIPAFTSPWTDGVNPAKSTSSDMVFSRYDRIIEPYSSYYNVKYGDLSMELLAEKNLTEYQDYVIGDFVANYILEDYISDDISVNKYQRKAGTVSSDGSQTFGDSQIGFFEDVSIDAFDLKSLTYEVGKFIGTGTNFATDFAYNDDFLVENELFKVYGVANNTFMLSERPAATPHTNVFIYKKI